MQGFFFLKVSSTFRFHHQSLCVALESYHRLFGDVHQVFDVIVLMLLKGREQHVQHLLFVSSRSFALLFLFLLMLDLQRKVNTDQISHTGLDLAKQYH